LLGLDSAFLVGELKDSWFFKGEQFSSFDLRDLLEGDLTGLVFNGDFTGDERAINYLIGDDDV